MSELEGQFVEARLHVIQDVINAYAAITNDDNPIHLDAEFAASTAMGGIIAHGMLSLNLVWQSAEATLGRQALEQAKLKVRFVRPVRQDATVVASGRPGQSPGAYVVWAKVGDEAVIEGDVHRAIVFKSSLFEKDVLYECSHPEDYER